MLKLALIKSFDRYENLYQISGYLKWNGVNYKSLDLVKLHNFNVKFVFVRLFFMEMVGFYLQFSLQHDDKNSHYITMGS